MVQQQSMRHHYLRAMGIDVWRLRQPHAPAFYSFTLSLRKQPVGMLLADAVLHSEEERKLVEAIANSTQMSVVGGLKTGNPSIDMIPHQVKVLILLGKRVEQFIVPQWDLKNNCSIIKSYSLAQLLADKKLKAVTWKALKKAIHLMNNS